MLDRKKLDNIYWRMSEVCSRTECLMRELDPHKSARESVNELSDDIAKAFEKFKSDFDFVKGVYEQEGKKNEKHNKGKN